MAALLSLLLGKHWLTGLLIVGGLLGGVFVGIALAQTPLDPYVISIDASSRTSWSRMFLMLGAIGTALLVWLGTYRFGLQTLMQILGFILGALLIALTANGTIPAWLGM